MNRLRSLILLCMTTTLYAEPIHIRAGFASIAHHVHEHTFRDTVEVDESQQHLRADWVKINTDEHHQLILAIARGHPAHLWSTEKEPTLHAYADEIQYAPKTHRVILIGHARLLQGKNSFSAPKMTYNTLTQHLVSEAQGPHRTTIILDQDHDTLIR